MRKFSDWISIIGGTLGFITTVVLFTVNLQSWINDPNMLHIFSVAAFILCALGNLWFFIKSNASAKLRWTSLVFLYAFSVLYFMWVGSWIVSTKTVNSFEQLPNAHIIEPKDGTVVDLHTPLLMDYSNIPSTGYVWVVERVPKYNQVYLWNNDELQISHKTNGVLSWNIQIGADTSVGDVFNIIILLVDEKVNFSFQENVKQCKSTGQCNGIILPDEGVQILAFSTVIRK